MNVSDIKKYKESLYSSLSRELADFEKNFLLLGGAILAFSLTFVKDIVKIDEAEYLCALLFSWFFMIFSIGIMMFSYITSAKSSQKLWNIADQFLNQKELFDDEAKLTSETVKQFKSNISGPFNEAKDKLSSYRMWAVIFFLLSVVSLSTFVSINLIRENRNKSVESGINNTVLPYRDTIKLYSKDTIYIIK